MIPLGGVKVWVALRQSPEDLRCDAEVGPASNSLSELHPRNKYIMSVTSSCVIRDKVLNLLS